MASSDSTARPTASPVVTRQCRRYAGQLGQPVVVERRELMDSEAERGGLDGEVGDGLAEVVLRVVGVAQRVVLRTGWRPG